MIAVRASKWPAMTQRHSRSASIVQYPPAGVLIAALLAYAGVGPVLGKRCRRPGGGG